MQQYNAAVARDILAPPPVHAKGSFDHVAKAYMASSYFTSLDPKTQSPQRRELEQIGAVHGALPIAAMRPAHVNKLMDEKPTPITADILLKALRALFKWALANDHLDFNPAAGVARRSRRQSTKSDPAISGYHTWTQAEIAKFDRTHRLGTQERLAKELLLCTAGRRERT